MVLKTHSNSSRLMAECSPCKQLEIAAENHPKQQQKTAETAEKQNLFCNSGGGFPAGKTTSKPKPVR